MVHDTAIYSDDVGEIAVGDVANKHWILVYKHPRAILPERMQALIQTRLSIYLDNVSYIQDKAVHLEPECLSRVLIKGIYDDLAWPGPRISSKKWSLPYVVVKFIPNEIGSRSWITERMDIDDDRCIALREADQRHIGTGGRMERSDRPRRSVAQAQLPLRYIWARHNPDALPEYGPHDQDHTHLLDHIRNIMPHTRLQHNERGHQPEQISQPFADIHNVRFPDILLNNSTFHPYTLDSTHDDAEVRRAMQELRLEEEQQQRTAEAAIDTDTETAGQSADNEGSAHRQGRGDVRGQSGRRSGRGGGRSRQRRRGSR
ncbi:MAG: hypothetical protein Q9159_006221 [Coniocarpon cinnabarinum]